MTDRTSAAANKVLLVVDPQIDFITGSLPVPGAESAMNALAGYIRRHGPEYAHIIVTADRHPMRHCSFKQENGRWPRHCVADSAGASIWPPVMDALLEMPEKVAILHKGENAGVEEYSIFKNREAAEKILRIIEAENAGQIDVCGLAGDVCVADTLCDAMTMAGTAKLNVLTEFSPSIDGGATLGNIILEHGLSCVR